MDKIYFKLFITGDSGPSMLAIANIKAICQDLFNGQCLIEIVDVRKEPDQAEKDKILATPTLIFQHKTRPRRVIGDLSNREKVLEALGIDNIATH